MSAQGVILAIVLVCAVLLLIKNAHDMRTFTVRNYEVTSGKLRRDLTIVLLSDLHDAVYGEDNAPVAAQVKALSPDLILVAGDMVTAYHDVHKVDTAHAVSLFQALCNIAPVFFSSGNHETKLKHEKAHFGDVYDRYMEALVSMGVQILDRTKADIDDANLTIRGLELPYEYFGHFRKKPLQEGLLNASCGEVNPERFEVLIAHNPQYFEEYAAYGADLTVSGHVHGGIIRLPVLGGVISPAAVPFPKYDGGLFHKGAHTMIVSRGLGTHSLPVRLGNPGEVICIRLKMES